MAKKSSQWSSTKARLVLAALLRNGWRIKRQRGSHRLLAKPGLPDDTFAYHSRYAEKDTVTGPGTASPCSRRSAITRSASAWAEAKACFRVRP